MKRTGFGARVTVMPPPDGEFWLNIPGFMAIGAKAGEGPTTVESMFTMPIWTSNNPDAEQAFAVYATWETSKYPGDFFMTDLLPVKRNRFHEIVFSYTDYFNPRLDDSK